MAEREWAGHWAGGSLPNDINNILYWVATAERGRERSNKRGVRGNTAKEWGKKREIGEKKFGKIKETVWGGQGVRLLGDLARGKT